MVDQLDVYNNEDDEIKFYYSLTETSLKKL